MSGGSYNYLCNATLSERDDDLRRMYDRLRELEQKKAARRDESKAYGLAADATHRILAALDVPDALSAVWKAVEWRDSSDWGEDQMDNHVLQHAGALLPAHPVPRARARITEEALALVPGGDLTVIGAVGRVRDILTAAGCSVEPHPLELARVERLREEAGRLLEEADTLEASL